jgi:hypothetical protein
MCGEADYLTAYSIPLKTAAEYAQRFTPRQVVELHQAGIGPDVANGQDVALCSLDIIALLQP